MRLKYGVFDKFFFVFCICVSSINGKEYGTYYYVYGIMRAMGKQTKLNFVAVNPM